MFNRKELKERAKLVLFRSYSKVFLACLIVNLLSGGGLGISSRKVKDIELTSLPPQKMFAVFVIIVAISLIALALTIFVLSPLKVGLKKFMIENAARDAQLNLLLTPFGEDYKNIVAVQFMKGLFIWLWSLPAAIPTAVMFVFTGKLVPLLESVYGGSITDALIVSGIAFLWLVSTLILSIPSIIKELQYVMVPYILADNPDTDWRSALSESKEMMVGNKWAFVKLILSFALWYLAANLLCCIGNFLLMPYVEATICELYLELSGQRLVNMEYEQENF